MKKEMTTMSTSPSTRGAAAARGEPLEVVAQRLARIHMSLATNLDGGRELQTWTREQIEDLMAYVDSVIDAQPAR